MVRSYSAVLSNHRHVINAHYFMQYVNVNTHSTKKDDVVHALNRGANVSINRESKQLNRQ